jgi:hypothetical protein
MKRKTFYFLENYEDNALDDFLAELKEDQVISILHSACTSIDGSVGDPIVIVTIIYKEI